MAVIESWFKQDLKEPVKVQMIKGNLFSADKQGNLIGVEVYDEGEVATLTGTVSASIIRPDGSTIAVEGTRSGNKCSVVLPEAAYVDPGVTTISVKLLSGDDVTTILSVVATIYRTETDEIIDPGTIIPSVEGLIAAIDAAIASIPADYSSLWETIAPTFTTDKSYVVGQYVTYDGNAYRFRRNHDSGSWNADDVKKVVLGDEIYSTNMKMDGAIDQLGSYEGSVVDKPYGKRIFGLYRRATVGTYTENYVDSSSRAITPIPGKMIYDNVLYINNPDKYPVGIYYRAKSNNEYIGYAQTITNAPFVKVVNLNTATYDYYATVTHLTGSTETNWTEEDLDTLHRRLCFYSGDYIDIQNDIFVRNINLIKPEMIHIGKYYHGAATPSTNAQMAYTDLIPVKEHKKYYMPYLTLGWSWYESDQTVVIGGNYKAVEAVAYRDPYITLEAPAGAAYLGVSVRSGDVPNMILSEVPISRALGSLRVSSLPVSKSNVINEPLNWLYDTDYKQNRCGSRLLQQNVASYDGEKVTLTDGGNIFCLDQITMDKSKIDVVFSVPESEAPSFVIGYNGYYALSSLSLADGAIGVAFSSDGETAEIRRGTGESGAYETLLKTVDISGLDIQNGNKFVCSIEKDTISRYIVSIYNMLTPDVIITETIEASVNSQDENLYTGQIRGWGGPFVRALSASLNVWKIQMYSTAPIYPKIAIWGDSYVENMGRNPLCSYGELLRRALHGNVFISGRGGATAEQASRRIAAEINCCAPQHIIFNVGVNDSFWATAAAYEEQIEKLIGYAKARNAEPILITVPRINDGTNDNLTWIQEVNPWIRSSGYRYIDVAYALSTGDGVTQDYTKFVADKTHPNLAGGQAIFNHIKTALPDLLWNDKTRAAQQEDLIQHKIIDALDSTSSTDMLSAKQGKVLKDSFDGLLKIKTTSKTVTTSASGAVNTGIAKHVISAYVKTSAANYACVLTYASGGNAWVTVYDITTWTKVVNTSVTIEIAYID